jgi:hypothetical protein
MQVNIEKIPNLFFLGIGKNKQNGGVLYRGANIFTYEKNV